MYLLDTNICIALLNNNPKVVPIFNCYFSQYYLSTIVVSELYKGVYCSKQVEKNLETLAQLTELLPIGLFDINAAKIPDFFKKSGIFLFVNHLVLL
jgi:tRNA(fMet)-specific endonuclease VapC